MLYPGDATPSYKPIEWWKPWKWLELFFDTCLIIKQWFVYVFPELIKLNWSAWNNWVRCNHVRIYVGYIILTPEFEEKYPELYDKLKDHVDEYLGVHVGFHWTSPKSEFFAWEYWMTDPGYARIYRHINSVAQPVEPMRVLEACYPYNNMFYDYGQLVDIGLGLHDVFDLGKKHKVCSVGVRIIMDKIFNDNVIPGRHPEHTLPCSFAYTPRLIRAYDE